MQVAALQEEQSHPFDDYYFYTLCWCAKEAVYKWWGNGKVDFRKHIYIERISPATRQIMVRFANETINATLALYFIVTQSISLVWTIA